MKTPPYLQAGDKIAITATARKFAPSDIINGLNAALHFGYEPVVSSTIGASHHIFSGTDELRAQELQGFLDNPEIKAIWFARGGYGSIRLIENLNWTAFKKNPKWLIGFSDVTNILAKVLDLKIESIHGPMLKTMEPNFEDEVSTNLLFSALAGEKLTYQWQATEHCVLGEAKGTLAGGNLATLAHVYPSLLSGHFKNTLLFIEEIDEYLYQIDRMLRGMKLSKRFAEIKGIIVGDFSNLKDNEKPFSESHEEIIKNVFGSLNIPIAFGFKAGHETQNWPLILGRECTLSFENNKWNLV